MSNEKDSLGDRMERYEGVSRTYLVRRMPVIIRIDGKAFHTFTKGFQKPFDMILMQSMWDTCKYLCAHIQGCKMAYTQSDEISLLLTDYETLTTDAWFENNIQKMVSVSASMATLAFNKAFSSNVWTYQGTGMADDCNTVIDENIEKQCSIYMKRMDIGAMFDSRVFNAPKEEVCNCLIWRQQDASRNSVEMVGRANFSDKQLFRKNCDMIQDMLFKEKDINWNDLPTYQKRGACIVKETYTLDNGTNAIRTRWVVDKDIPIFSQNREYIEKYL